MGRYLSAREKQEILKELDILYPEAKPFRNPGLDLQIVPYLKRLNKLDGVATVMSCSGHLNIDTIDNGYLWLRLSKEVMAKFYKQAPELAKHPQIHTVAIRFLDPFGEIVELWFDGEERDVLNITGEFIAQFFENL